MAGLQVFVDPPAYSTRRAEASGRRALRAADLVRRDLSAPKPVDGGGPGTSHDTLLDAGGPSTVFSVAEHYTAGGA